MHSHMKRTALIRQKIKETIDNGGYVSLAKKSFRLLHRLAYYSSASSVWFRRDLREPVPDAQPGLDLKFDFLTDDKQALIDWLKSHGRKFTWMHIEKEIALANREGHIFVQISQGNKTAGYIKVGINSTYIHDFDRVVIFPPGTAFIYDTFILPEYRGNKISFYALMKTMHFLKDRDYRKLFCHIESWNAASSKTFRRAGFKEICTVRFSKILGLPVFLKNGYIPLASINSILA